MDPISLVKLAWSDARTRIIFPGILLASGAGLAGLPTTGGRVVCDQGMCVQEQTAAFGTVRNAIMYPTSEIEGFRVERGDTGEMSRVVIDLRGMSEPLTVPFTLSVREVERIASEGSRFLSEGAVNRFVAALEVQGLQTFYRPIALASLSSGRPLLAGFCIRCHARNGNSERNLQARPGVSEHEFMETNVNWLDLRKIYEQSKYREKRKKELRNEVERRFPHLSNRKYVIALAGDRKVEWRPDFIKRTGGSKADMQFECYDIATGEPVSTTVWWTYNGSKSKGDVTGSSGTLHLRAKFLIVTWKVKAWGNKTKDIVIFYYE